MDEHFGLKWHGFHYYPESALQGPFLTLLNANPTAGISLITKLANVATERYVRLD